VIVAPASSAKATAVRVWHRAGIVAYTTVLA